MNTYNKNRWTFYMPLTEHFFRLATRRLFEDVQGAVGQKWYKDTSKWLLDKCTAEERTLIRDFYTYNQSVRGCTNYKVTEAIYDIADRFAADMGLC